MNARPKAVESVEPGIESGCATCAARELTLCRVVSELAWSLPQGESIEVKNSSHVVPARRAVFRDDDLHDAVPVICAGWAACIVPLSDGSRQILSFLLPGDVVSSALLFDGRAYCSVEAITEVRCRSFKRAALKASLYSRPDLLEKFSRAWIEEKTRADQLIIDLGRRTARERIARLILGLQDRLARRGLAHADTEEIEFPLRQHHIADATGLTTVHVNKVLSEFRCGGVIKIGERSLTVLDPVRFRRVANMR